MTVPEMRPGCDANCFPAISVNRANIPWKAWAIGRKICGKALRITWKMSNDARMFERVSMGLNFAIKLTTAGAYGNVFSMNAGKRGDECRG
jgi:hypothetical protein